MPVSERVQTRIDQMLAEADAAADASNWEAVRRRCEAVLDLDPDNAAAKELLEAMRRFQLRTHGRAAEITGPAEEFAPPPIEAVGALPQRAAAAGSPMNIVRRVSMRGGWIGFFSGESQGKALERCIPQLNAEGYRVAFVVDDKWSLAKKLLNLLLMAVTLGIYSMVQNVMLIGERIERSDA